MDGEMVEPTAQIDPASTLICTDCFQTVMEAGAVLVPEPTQNDATRWVCPTCYALNHQDVGG
jgi:hypothetical protein